MLLKFNYYTCEITLNEDDDIHYHIKRLERDYSIKAVEVYRYNDTNKYRITAVDKIYKGDNK